MNEQQLRTALNLIAEEEIGENSDMWNQIQSSLPDVTSRRFSRWNQVGRMAAVFIAVIVISTVGYALYQMGIGGDPGLISVSDRVTPLDLTASVNGYDVNIKIPYAYADGHRIAVWWEVDHAPNLIVGWPTLRLFDAGGNEFGYADFLGGGGGGGGGSEDRVMFGSQVSFDATGIEGNPESLELRLVVELGSIDPGASREYMPGTGGGSGGGGGGTAAEGQTPQLTPVPPTNFEFTFAVPFIPAVKFTDVQSQTANDLEMTISELSYAPSITLAQICFDLPDEQEWAPFIPDTTIIIPEPLNAASFFAAEDPNEKGQRCGNLSIMTPLPYDEENKTFTLTVTRLESWQNMTPELMEEFRLRAAEQGFEIKIQPGPKIGFEVVKYPDNLQGDYNFLVNEILQDVVGDRVEGPWEFVFTNK